MSLRKEQEKGNDHRILGELLNSLWWPVYVQKVHGYNRIVCAFKRSIRSGEFGSEPFPH